MRARLYLLVGLTALLFGPASGLTQYPGGRYSGTSGMSGMFDPNSLWDKMAQGKNVVTRNDVPPGFFQGMFDRMADRMGITNGQITREQFMGYMQQRMAERSGGAPSGAPSGSTPSGTSSPGGSPAGGDWSDGWFRRFDQNGDGLLNFDEMSDSLRLERDKWDANRDGFIDQNEYKTYFQARVQQYQSERGSGPPPFPGELPAAPVPIEDDPKPIVYRIGKLPKELPGWFSQLDTDTDAQVGLYEWRSSGRALDEFRGIDRNNDGFLTVEEVLRFEKQSKDKPAVAATAGPSNGSSGTSPGGNGSSRSGFGGPSRYSRGR